LKNSVDNALTVGDMRDLARRRLPRFIFDFIDGGAEDEVTLRENRQAFENIRLRPRVLNGRGKVDLRTSILGLPLGAPMAISPTGMASVAHPSGELHLARAAKARGVPFSVSTSSSVSLEQLAEVGARLWFQLYHYQDIDLVRSLLERAERANAELLIVTVDVPVLAGRERDRRNRFALPFRFNSHLVADAACHPAWALAQLRHGMPRPAMLPARPEAASLKAGQTIPAAVLDPELTWDHLARLRDTWKKPILIKGILAAEDAELAASYGFDGVVVSNHGGRQLDGAPASIDALPQIVQQVGGRMEVLLDGGVRRGSDIVKALALGARAVMFGRPTLYGLAAGGQAGAERVLQTFERELRRAMALLGCRSVAELSPEWLHKNTTSPDAWQIPAVAKGGASQSDI
jgi:(S)-mandelate dehydrogenase